MNSRFAFLLPLLVVDFLVGCRREDIRVYDAPKEHVTARAAVPPPTPTLAELPEGWEQLPADQFSIEKFVVRGKDGAKVNISVSALPPSDETANVNRWRRQVGLEPAPAAQVAKQREPAQIGGHDASLFDLAGAAADTQKKTRIVAALAILDGTMWFFKMMGDEELAAAQKPAFKKFIASYPLPGHDHSAEQGTATDATIAPPAKPEAAATASGRWKIPTNWKEEKPGAMQEAKFTAANGRAVVTISIFPGETGGLRANVDRWRGQVGLGPVSDEDFPKVQTPLDLPDAKATIVDMTGPDQRFIVALVVRGGSTWFIKLLGPPAAVGAEKSAFLEFVKTTK